MYRHVCLLNSDTTLDSFAFEQTSYEVEAPMSRYRNQRRKRKRRSRKHKKLATALIVAASIVVAIGLIVAIVQHKSTSVDESVSRTTQVSHGGFIIDLPGIAKLHHTNTKRLIHGRINSQNWSLGRGNAMLSLKVTVFDPIDHSDPLVTEYCNATNSTESMLAISKIMTRGFN
jgi:hypothetical protein